MERVFAPWRMAYINQLDDPGCVFCSKLAANDDRANLILYRGRDMFVIMNLYPYNSGHLLVLPYRHVAGLEDLTQSERAEMMEVILRCTRALTEAYKPQGFNIGFNLGKCAGAGVADHVHAHIVPRWTGDTNFMPALADTKVLPQSLDQTYEALRPHFRD
jgi:ATP adenylyltransferase